MLPDNDKSSAKFTRLRREALELLSRQPGLVSSKSGANIKELIHELNVHQTELVIQNEELKQSQRDLAKISREYEDLYELAPCGYITLTAKQTISRINKAALSFLGEKELKLNLSTFGQFIEPGWDDFFHTALKNAAQTGNTQSIDLKLRNKAGLPLWIQMEIEADCDEKGQVLQWRLVFVDISQKIAAETALQESQERFKSLFHNAPIAYQSLDKDGNFIEVNDAWLSILGYARDEVIGQNFGNFLHPDMQDHFKKNFPRFKVVGEILGVEFEMCKKKRIK
ncbi:MAG: PAS domain-containing protein [Proteobacteria bacterium]|nr:PAS domain-containing protein [Pseudomonadota bacterium]MBU1583719.1 PAS domain-containing protein [Pseudomonadota bacterium]MBU2453620.1 PAS domain-containing protein [Pseudomonadota bacterium]